MLLLFIINIFSANFPTRPEPEKKTIHLLHISLHICEVNRLLISTHISYSLSLRSTLPHTPLFHLSDSELCKTQIISFS
jgi:hypothetical protein